MIQLSRLRVIKNKLVGFFAETILDSQHALFNFSYV